MTKTICSFCGAGEDERSAMVQGPDIDHNLSASITSKNGLQFTHTSQTFFAHAAICDQCIERCTSIINEATPNNQTKKAAPVAPEAAQTQEQ